MIINLSTLLLAANPILQAKIKYIGLDLYFVKEKVMKKETSDQLVDVFTKTVLNVQFNSIRFKLGIENFQLWVWDGMLKHKISWLKISI